MATVSAICALPFVGTLAGGSAGLALKVIGHSLTFGMAAQGTWEAAGRAVEAYRNETLSEWNFLDVGLNALGMGLSGRAAFSEGRKLANRIAAGEAGQRTVKRIKQLAADNRGSVDIGALEAGKSKGGSKTVDDVYAGVKQAFEYLKQQGVPRTYRKQILESFDVRTIKLETAGESTYGLRFYGGNASVEGRYLFETFFPQANRANLALPYEWNSMTGIQQFQVKSGTTMLTGAAAPQTGFGSQYIGGAHQWYINSLEDMIKCQ